MTIYFALVKFLELLARQPRGDSIERFRRFSRIELLSLYNVNFEDSFEFSEIVDLLFTYRCMDADIKSGGIFDGYHITEEGINYLRNTELFYKIVIDGQRDESIIVDRPVVVSSTRWTGAQFVLVDRSILQNVRTIANDLHSVVHSMHFTSNSESQDLKALTDALLAICSMAEPEVTILDRILSSPKFKVYAKLFAMVAAIRGAIGI